MRLVYPEEPPKVPLAIKLFIGSIAAMVFAAIGGMAFMVFVIMSDPIAAGGTLGEVGASIINGFNHVLED